MQVNSYNKPVSLIFQFFMVIVTSIILMFSIYRASYLYTTSDAAPALIAMTPKTIERFGGSPSGVQVNLFINDFTIFDPVKNDFEFNGILCFESDPALIPLEALGQFKFQQGEIVEKSKPYSQIMQDKLWVRYDIKVRFKSGMEYRFFPFDDHRIFLNMINSAMQPNEMIFEASLADFEIKGSTTSLLGWKLVNHKVQAGYVESIIDVNNSQKNVSHPSVLFSADFKRTGSRYATTILLPLLAIFFVSLFVFSLNPSRYSTLIVSLAAGSVTALLAYRFVIENLSPAVGYFMLSDYIFFLFLLTTALVFFFSIMVNRLHYVVKNLIVILLHGIVVSACIYLMFFWIKA